MKVYRLPMRNWNSVASYNKKENGKVYRLPMRNWNTLENVI